MHNEFTLVKSKRGKRRSQRNPIQTNYRDCGSDLIDDIKLKRKLTEIIEKLTGDQFTVEFLADIQCALSKLQKSVVDIILCYGLGKFSESISSLHQLAFVIYLQRTFKSVVEVFDPVFSSAETDFLKTFGLSVIEDNEEGKRVLEDDKLTLVFLPHCPKQLVNNFLWANWNQKLRNCILISNSFSEIVLNNSEKTIYDSANYILRSLEICDEIHIKDTYDYPNVFNNTSIHFFYNLESNLRVFELPAEEPNYSEDTEFVRRENRQTENIRYE